MYHIYTLHTHTPTEPPVSIHMTLNESHIIISNMTSDGGNQEGVLKRKAL